eukprot:gene27143-35867_t
MDAPKESNLHVYIKECKRQNVRHIVRISEPSYSKEEVENAGIKLHEMYYPDGQSPPAQILTEWLQLLSATFENNSKDDTPCIAIHCVAGLGRAPVLVAIALIERGAINAKQLEYLAAYKPQHRGKKCCIM